ARGVEAFTTDGRKQYSPFLRMAKTSGVDPHYEGHLAGADRPAFRFGGLLRPRRPLPAAVDLADDCDPGASCGCPENMCCLACAVLEPARGCSNARSVRGLSHRWRAGDCRACLRNAKHSTSG